MTDLRQGVTETQHAVLDLIERRSVDFRRVYNLDDRIHWAIAHAQSAKTNPIRQFKAEGIILAAAMLIDAADELDCLINANGTGGAN